MRSLTVNPLADREDAAINGMNAALGVILLISPWLLGFAAEPAATWSAVIGGVIAAAALAAFTRLLEWEEWVNLVAGLCVAASPWLIGFLHPLRPRRGRISPSGCRSPCWRPSSFGGFTERRPRVAPERAGAERAGTVRVLPSSGSRPRASAARAVKRHTW